MDITIRKTLQHTITIVVMGLLSLAALSIATAASLSFGPSYNIYELKVGETLCKTIWYNTNTEKAIVNDIWSVNHTEWKIRTFTQDSIPQLVVTFKPETEGLSSNWGCITGLEKGSYKGGMLVQGKSQSGNQHVRGLIWNKVIVS